VSTNYQPGAADDTPTRPDLMKDPHSAGHGRGGTPLNVTWNDLQDPRVLAQADRMRDAQQQPAVRQVGPPPALAPSVWWRGNLASLTLAGLVGGLLGELVTEILLQPDSATHWYGTSATTGNVLFSVVLSLVIGAVIAGWDGITTKDRVKVGQQLKVAAPLLLGVGLVGGFISSSIYQSMAKSVAEGVRAGSHRTGLHQLRS
jgi:hypothetical protein